MVMQLLNIFTIEGKAYLVAKIFHACWDVLHWLQWVYIMGKGYRLELRKVIDLVEPIRIVFVGCNRTIYKGSW